jgi:hypothetical protein
MTATTHAVAASRGGSFSPGAASPRLPGLHFAVALVHLAAGAIGLVVVAPDLAQGAFYLPRVIAVVHLFTLGFIVTTIFGALCQFLPVAVGRPMRSSVAAHVSFGAQSLGVGCFVAALIAGNPQLLHVGACGLSTAFVVFAINLAATLAPARERSLTWWALAGAALFLLVTPIYGVVLALDLHGGFVTDRFALVAQHAHVAILGVVLLVAIGVAHRLLPMFLLSHGASERPGWIAIALTFAGAFLLSVPVAFPLRAPIAGTLGCAGVLAFVAQAATFFRHRKRRAIDAGMRLAAVGISALALASVLAPFALGRGLADLRLLATYFVVLLGGLTLFVAGHYYKIVPFLVWYYRFGPLVGERRVPTVAELFDARIAFVDGAVLVVGLLGVALGTFTGVATIARAGACVFAAGALLEIVVIAQVARRRLA